MKKILTVFVFVAAATSAFAQFNKGRILAGGSVSLATQTGDVKYTSFTLAPDGGIFIADNIAVGASLGLGVGGGKNGTTKSSASSISITPFARYYLPQGVFFQAHLGPGVNKSKTTYTQNNTEVTTKSTTNTFVWGLGAGYAYFLNDNVALEPFVGYRSTSSKPDGGTKATYGTLSLQLGFQIYLGERK